MTSAKQLRLLTQSPRHMMEFQRTGRLPRMVRPSSPLIDLLTGVSPRDRAWIVGLTVDDGLGYVQSRQFQTAEQALRWVRPDTEMEEGRSWPAESYRDKRFDKRLYLEDLLNRAASYPEGVMDRHRHLCWSEGRNAGGRLLAELRGSQLAVDNNRIEHEGSGVFRFSGNFAGVSHAFNFRSKVAEVIVRFCDAIFANRESAAYVAEVERREAASQEYEAGLQMTGNTVALKEAQEEWRQTRPVKGRAIGGAVVPEALALRLGLKG